MLVAATLSLNTNKTKGPLILNLQGDGSQCNLLAGITSRFVIRRSAHAAEHVTAGDLKSALDKGHPTLVFDVSDSERRQGNVTIQAGQLLQLTAKTKNGGTFWLNRSRHGGSRCFVHVSICPPLSGMMHGSSNGRVRTRARPASLSSFFGDCVRALLFS